MQISGLGPGKQSHELQKREKCGDSQRRDEAVVQIGPWALPNGQDSVDDREHQRRHERDIEGDDAYPARRGLPRLAR